MMRTPVSASLLVLLLAACSETPTRPVVSDKDAAPVVLHADVQPVSEAAPGFSVVTIHLRPEDTSETTVWGALAAFTGRLYPPNPCMDDLESAAVVICGVLHNPNEELLTGGSLTITPDIDLPPARLQFSVPPSPCLSYQIRALAAAELGGTEFGQPAVEAEFSTALGRVITVQVAPGPPNEPSVAGGFVWPGSPTYPPNPCLVGFALRGDGG